MAWSLLASGGSNFNSSDSGTVTLNTTGADLLVATLSQYNAASQATLNDGQSNIWQLAGAYLNASPGFNASQTYYCFAPNTSATHNFSGSGASAFPGVGILAFSGSINSGTYDAIATATANNVTTFDVGSITPTVNGELVVSCMGISDANNAGLAISSGTIAVNVPYNGSTGDGVYMAWQTQATAGAIDPVWSWTNTSPGFTGVNVSFKPVASGPPPTLNSLDYRNGFLVTAATATQGPFGLLGGKYAVSVHTGTWNGAHVALTILAPNGSTYVATAANFTADGYAILDLPPGLVQMTVSVATPTNVNFNCIPVSWRR